MTQYKELDYKALDFGTPIELGTILVQIKVDFLMSGAEAEAVRARMTSLALKEVVVVRT